MIGWQSYRRPYPDVIDALNAAKLIKSQEKQQVQAFSVVSNENMPKIEAPAF